jgi:hypothetical protein
MTRAKRYNLEAYRAERVRVLEAALGEIAREQSAKSATEAADRFQTLARRVLASKEG